MFCINSNQNSVNSNSTFKGEFDLKIAIIQPQKISAEKIYVASNSVLINVFA